MKMKIVGIDLALRNSALVALDEDLNLINVMIITSSSKKYDGEDLLNYNCKLIIDFVKDNNIHIAMIEGLAFNSTSLAKDIIAGNFWNIRLKLYELNKEYHIIAPVSWRAKVFSKEQKDALKTYRKENGKYNTRLKDTALECVPDNIQKTMKKYLTDNKLSDKFIYDLADAYCIAKHGVLLYNESK